MTNSFQKAILSRKHDDFLWDVILLFYPEPTMTREKLFGRLEIKSHYDWITLYATVHKRMRISMGIQYVIGLHGPQPRESFDKVYGNLDKWKAWQFVDSMPRSPENNHRNIGELAKKHNIPFPTADEMYKYYYED